MQVSENVRPQRRLLHLFVAFVPQTQNSKLLDAQVDADLTCVFTSLKAGSVLRFGEFLLCCKLRRGPVLKWDPN